jgi:hypothetical protein
MNIVRPLGRITTVDASTIDAAYPSGNGGGVINAKEILRATTVKVNNESDSPVVVRLVQVQVLDTSTGEPTSIFQQHNTETFNYYDMIVKPHETVYVSKHATATVLDDPNVPTYLDTPPAGGETIQLRLAEGLTAGTGNIYLSPVSLIG